MTIQAHTRPSARARNAPPSPQRLAALTAACLLIDDARIYGLIDAGHYIDRARCRRLLAKLKSEGVEAGSEEIERAALELMAELGVVRA